MDDFVELRRVIVIILRRWWLLILVTALAAILGYTLSQRQEPVYRATTTVLVGQIFQSNNIDRQDILTSELVAQTYSDMIRRQPVLQAVVDSLGLSQAWQQLRKEVSVELVENTQLIQITVEADSPLAAQMIADEVARQTILFSPAGSNTGENVEVRQFVQRQLENLQARIETGQNKLASLEGEMLRANTAEQLSELQGEVNTLEGLVTDWENTYTQLLGFLQSGQSPNTLTVIEPAQASSNPVRPQVELLVLVAAGAGIVLALGLIFLLEYLDDTYKTPEEITREFGLPVIGLINETGENGDNKNTIFVSEHPRTPIAEAYRSLRANLEFVSVDKPLKSILITSFNIGIGKSSVSANLAVAMAQGEKDVILVDADLRKSSIHKFAGLPNNVGLSDVFRNEMEVSEVRQDWEAGKIGVITSGVTPPNPSELLGSKKMDHILASLGDISEVAIIDSPPFIVSDALLLAAKVDGVVLVIRPGLTRRKFARTMMEQLNRAGARVLGVVMNRIPSRGPEYYGEYQYYRSYYEKSHYAREEQQQDFRGGAISKFFDRISGESLKIRFGERKKATDGSKNGHADSSSTKEAQENQVSDPGVPSSVVAGISRDPNGTLTRPLSLAIGNTGHELDDDAAGSVGSWLDYVPSLYRDAVFGVFHETPGAETLTDDLEVYSHWGGGADEIGSHLFSTKVYARPSNARRFLSLPDYNAASKVSQLVVPKGTTIILGKAAAQSGNPGFGTYAVGGGVQIYLPNPRSAILIGQVR